MKPLALTNIAMRNFLIIIPILLFFSALTISSVAQNTTLSSGGNGTGSGGSFSYSFGQLANHTFFQESSSFAQGVQHPFEINYVPSLISVFDTTVTSSLNDCFDALSNITVAGSGYQVTIDNSAEANFIAGKSIRFLPGFNARHGSLVHGYITTTYEFCNGGLLKSIVAAPDDENLKAIVMKDFTENTPSIEQQVNIYPNPNNGCFKINLINFENSAIVCVYNMMGVSFHKARLQQSTTNEINLSDLQKGIYFVRVSGDNKQFVKKIIVK